MEGAVCWVEAQGFAYLTSIPAAGTGWLGVSHLPAPHLLGIPGGTALLFKLASTRHVILGLRKLMGGVHWLSQVLVFVSAKRTRNQRSKARGATRSYAGFVN